MAETPKTDKHKSDIEFFEAQRLTERLFALEGRVADSPSKIKFSREYALSDTSPILLAFDRDGDEWAFFVSDWSSQGVWRPPTLLHNASLLRKAEVAALLPDFLKSMDAEQKRRAGLIAKAHTALDALERQHRLNEVEAIVQRDAAARGKP